MNVKHCKIPVAKVDEGSFELEVLRSTSPVIVVFQSPWSHPCQILDATLNEVAAACVGKATILKVNADDNPNLSLWYEVQSIPSLLFFIQGALRARLVGTASKEAILTQLQTLLSGNNNITIRSEDKVK
jgi:thioredoxin 1